MFGLDSNTLIGVLIGFFLGFYLGNKEFRVKVNDMIFKKKAKPDATNVHQNTTEKRERDD